MSTGRGRDAKSCLRPHHTQEPRGTDEPWQRAGRQGRKMCFAGKGPAKLLRSSERTLLGMPPLPGVRETAARAGPSQ